MIIGITGQAQSGKDTLATAIQEHLQGEGIASNYGPMIFERGAVPILHFADALRDVVEAVFGSRYETQEQKAEIDPYWQDRIGESPFTNCLANVRPIGPPKITGRHILQRLGTEMFRNQVHQDIWLFVMERRIATRRAQYHIISDVRFDNEAEFVRKQGGIVVQVRRSDQREPSPDAHASEQGINDDLIDRSFCSWSAEQTREVGRTIAEALLKIRK